VAANPTYTYAAAGTYNVTLTVTDDDSASDGFSDNVTVTAANVAPTAGFTFSTSDLTATFTDTSTDSDGTIASWSWDFGDGGSSTAANPTYTYAANPTYTYAAAGTYNVTLTVTDDDSASDGFSDNVTVTAASLPPAAPTNLTASVQSSGQGKNTVVTGVQLNWSDNSNNEDSFVIERCEETGKGKNKTCNFSEVATVGANITSFSDSPGPDSGTYKYRVKASNGQGDSAFTNTTKIRI
jgi:PKD repeat protein